MVAGSSTGTRRGRHRVVPVLLAVAVAAGINALLPAGPTRDEAVVTDSSSSAPTLSPAGAKQVWKTAYQAAAPSKASIRAMHALGPGRSGGAELAEVGQAPATSGSSGGASEEELAVEAEPQPSAGGAPPPAGRSRSTPTEPPDGTTRLVATTTTRASVTTTTRAPASTTTRAPASTTTTTAPVTVFVFDGQSNSRAPSRDQAYPAVVVREGFPGTPSVVVAVNGSTYLQRSDDAPTRVDRYAHEGDRQTLFTEGGQTDLTNGVPAAELLQRVTTYVAGRRGAGFDVVIAMTIPPAAHFTAAMDQERRAFNQLLRERRAAIGIDVLVDIAAEPRIQDPHDTRYYSDGLHYTAETTAIVGRAALRAMGR